MDEFRYEITFKKLPELQRRSVADFLQRKGIMNYVVQVGVDLRIHGKKQPLKAKLLPHQVITVNNRAWVR